MQSKRRKRSRIRAAKITSGHGHKKKNRGAGHRGGRGKSNAGKRGDAKIMKITKGMPRKEYLGKHGFKSLKKEKKAINLSNLQEKLDSLLKDNLIDKSKDIYVVDLNNLGYEKLLSKGKIYSKMEIKVKFASKNTVSKVEKSGCKIELTEKEQ